jgi:hypothetical protein
VQHLDGLVSRRQLASCCIVGQSCLAQNLKMLPKMHNSKPTHLARICW